jgi:glycosyltransferase involved in cell wall biosynthesis
VTFDKGQHLVVAAIRRLARSHGWTGASVVFAGAATDEAYLSELKSEIDCAGLSPSFRFVFAGALDLAQLRAAYLDASLVVLSSFHEGLPRVVIEAQSMGVPVLATNVGGASEALIDGVTGILVPPGDVAQLATQMDAVVNQARLPANLGVRARAFVESRHSLTALAARHEDFYRQVLGGAFRFPPGVTEPQAGAR